MSSLENFVVRHELDPLLINEAVDLVEHGGTIEEAIELANAHLPTRQLAAQFMIYVVKELYPDNTENLLAEIRATMGKDPKIPLMSKDKGIFVENADSVDADDEMCLYLDYTPKTHASASFFDM